jgi:hypothetical protein
MEKLNKNIGKSEQRSDLFIEGKMKVKSLNKSTHERAKPSDCLAGSSASTIELLRKYVGNDGLLIKTVELVGYAQIMRNENIYEQQLLLLKILVASLNNNDDLAAR